MYSKEFQSVFNVNQGDNITNNFGSRIPPTYPDHKKFTFLKQSEIDIFRAASYQFTLDPSVLIQSSQKSRRAIRYRKTGEGKPPRPQNVWVLYRRDMNERLNLTSKDYVELKSSSEKSKEISKMWKKERKEVRDLFNLLARWAEEEHNKIYKDYKYQPVKNSESKSKGGRQIAAKKDHDNDNNVNNVNNDYNFSANLSNLSSPSFPLSAEFENNLSLPADSFEFEQSLIPSFSTPSTNPFEFENNYLSSPFSTFSTDSFEFENDNLSSEFENNNLSSPSNSFEFEQTTNYENFPELEHVNVNFQNTATTCDPQNFPNFQNFHEDIDESALNELEKIFFNFN